MAKEDDGGKKTYFLQQFEPHLREDVKPQGTLRASCVLIGCSKLEHTLVFSFKH